MITIVEVIALQIDNWIVLDLKSSEVISDNIVSVRIPKNIKIWEYFFRIMTKDWVYENQDLKIFVE